MASLNATIDFLEKLPEDIRSRGEEITKSCIRSNGHVDTENMINSTRAFAHGDHVQIVVWTRYAKWVNDGHGGADPGHVMTFKVSPKWPAVTYQSKAMKENGLTMISGRKARRVGGYGGSGFFDQAYMELLAYIHTL